jgi:hypothetical protein
MLILNRRWRRLKNARVTAYRPVDGRRQQVPLEEEIFKLLKL